MWNVLTVPTVWNFNCPRQRGMFLLFRQYGILIALTVWDFNCPQQCGIFLLFLECGILTGQLKYHTVGTVRTLHIVVDS
jgi:hypothetical protein